jgi:hypothetical protein
MRSIIRARLRSDELAQLLEELKSLRRLTYTQMCDVLAVPRKRCNRLQKQMLGLQAFSSDEIQAHVARLDTGIRDHEWVELAARLPELLRSIYSPPIDLPNALSGWLDLDGTQRTFQAQRTGENGSFLILRLNKNGKEDTRLICSWMLIRSPSVRSPVAEFLTQRPKTNGISRYVRGIIFQRGGLIFSFGKARHSVGFRSTILSPENRSTDRFDMFGARLGLQESPEVPYAYPIYCYQLKRPRTRSEIARLTGYKSARDSDLVQQINGLDRIVEQLHRAATNRFGVFGGPSD